MWYPNTSYISSWWEPPQQEYALVWQCLKNLPYNLSKSKSSIHLQHISKYLGYTIGWESTSYRKKFQIPRRSTSKAATMTSNAFWLKLGIDTLCNEDTHANLKSVLTAYPPSMPKHVNNYLGPNLEGSIIKIFLIIPATQCIQLDFQIAEVISIPDNVAHINYTTLQHILCIFPAQFSLYRHNTLYIPIQYW